MADTATINVSNYVSRMGINISALSRETGIPDGILRRSIVKKERDLRAGEFMSICNFLGKPPLDFYPDRDKAGMDTGHASA